jgi:hypothetical protein
LFLQSVGRGLSSSERAVEIYLLILMLMGSSGRRRVHDRVRRRLRVGSGLRILDDNVYGVGERPRLRLEQ